MSKNLKWRSCEDIIFFRRADIVLTVDFRYQFIAGQVGIMKIMVFGEVLWDIFGKEKTIGGAPFNFAAHAAKLGADVQLISALGRDELGDEALAACSALGVPDRFIARTDYPTGYCEVTLHEGTPEYDLAGDVAYDHIPLPADINEAGSIGGPRPDVLYFGTLAQRGEESRKTLLSLLERFGAREGFPGTGGESFDDIISGGRPAMAQPGCEVFFDINIRQHYYSDEMIDRSMRCATILKVSREEIGVFGIEGSSEEICPQLAKRYPNLKMIIVTLDKDGAFAYSCGIGGVTYAPKPECEVVSTVGAGDSFSAAFLVSYMNGCGISQCLEKATALASYVVGHEGAVPDYSDDIMSSLITDTAV